MYFILKIWKNAFLLVVNLERYKLLYLELNIKVILDGMTKS